MSQSELIQNLKKYGDRTSSFITLRPEFLSHSTQNQIRYIKSRSFNIAATEPLTAPQDRANALMEFAKDTQAERLHSLICPVSETLSTQMLSQGWHRECVGVEPIFNLQKYFEGKDPLDRFPIAKSLRNRNAQCVEINLCALTANDRESIEALVERWKNFKGKTELGFLNQIKIFDGMPYKRIFVLKIKEQILALVGLVPVFARHGLYTSELIRDPAARSGAMELLLIEVMRTLRDQGVREIRLGLCPLAETNPKTRTGRILAFVFKHLNFIYPFQTLYLFKKKLNPTEWEPVYVISPKPIGMRALLALLEVHMPQGFLPKTFPGFPALPVHPLLWMSRFKGLVLILSVLILIQAFKVMTDQGAMAYSQVGFHGDAFSVKGWLLGPLFHNHAYHFVGDLLSIAFFGFLVEWALGSRMFLVATAIGFWLSNPLALLTLWPLKFISLDLWAQTLDEKDYGSSNAVYVFVGLVAFRLQRPYLILVPFVINSIFIAVQRQSFLAVHHLVSIAMGLVLYKIISKLSFGSGSQHQKSQH